MKTVTPALLNLLKTSQFFKVNLYTVVLANNLGTLRYCSGDKDVIANGLFYPSSGVYGSSPGVGGPYFDDDNNVLKMHQKIGITVDTLTFDIIPGNATVLGVPFATACKNGIFDSAVFTVERCYMPNYGDTSAGTIIVFKGRVGDINIGRSMITFNINSFIELLDIDLPRNVYQPGCVNILGDPTCGVNLASYAVALTCAAGSSVMGVAANTSGLNQSPGYYNLGRITFTSGALNGQVRSVMNYSIGSPGLLVILGVMPVAPAAGDTFILTPGCDKSMGANGCPKFNNTARFRGFRFIPQPATAF